MFGDCDGGKGVSGVVRRNRWYRDGREVMANVEASSDLILEVGRWCFDGGYSRRRCR